MQREGEGKILKHSERREARLIKVSSTQKNFSRQSVIHSVCVIRDGVLKAPEVQLDEVCHTNTFCLVNHILYNMSLINELYCV